MASATRPDICRRIQEAREEADISQEEAAKRLHLSLGGYAAYERYREPKPSRLRQIARALEKPEDHFVTTAAKEAPSESDEIASLRAEVAAVRALAEQILKLLRRRAARPSPPKANEGP